MNLWLEHFFHKVGNFERAAGVFCILLFVQLVNHKQRRQSLIKLITTPAWILNFSVLCMWCYFLFVFDKNTDKKTNELREATKKGIVAAVIAVLAYLEFTLAPFWIVLIISYYLEGWTD